MTRFKRHRFPMRAPRMTMHSSSWLCSSTYTRLLRIERRTFAPDTTTPGHSSESCTSARRPSPCSLNTVFAGGSLCHSVYVGQSFLYRFR